ncbi:MAG: VCBS repeat-containing protein [Myxococcota bacterium]
MLLVATLAYAAPVLVPQDDALDVQLCEGGGCWTNYLRADDLNGDGHLDVIVANYSGFFEEGFPQRLGIYQNDGSAQFTEVSATAMGGFAGRVRQVAAGDIDADGDLDLYVPDGTGNPAALFINDGTGRFVDEQLARLPAVPTRAGATRMGDLDGDGDLDIIVTDGYAQSGPLGQLAHLLLNDGAGTFTNASDQLPTTWATGEDHDDLDLFDADRDFDLDILINAHAGDNTLWLNDGTGRFTDASDNLAPARSNFHYNPGICDVNGDGHLDIWVDNIGPSFTEQLLINDGTGRFVEETRTRVTGNPGADDNGVACADLDHDNDFDAIVWSLEATERVLTNDGTGTFSPAKDGFAAVADPTLWGDVGDFDGDGILDAVTGQGEGFPETNLVYLGTAPAMADPNPPIVTHQQAPGTVDADTPTTVRFAVRDAVVTDRGPRLRRAFARGDFGQGIEEVPARFVGGDLFHVVLPGLVAGTTTDVTLCAEDRAGNEGCGAAQTYATTGEPPPPDPKEPKEPKAPPDTPPNTPIDVGPEECGCSGTGGTAPMTLFGLGLVAPVVRRKP